ncbi:hypothetical protein [Yersinia intermedia]|uniref:hypothetical protein n=1 Tax=Yersinia intermedia TaxID=631 RepID=UPI0022FEAAEE|nr:hypothetical protein [Yersinia intermedia]MDA5510523.1 hypothetical protein [Yersinia intermedia]
MAKSATERKQAQRMRQAAGGIVKFELKLDGQEVGMLRQNCALRRPQRDPYDMDEYITMLIRKDNAELQAQLKEQAGRKCGKCGDALPGDPKGCLLIGDSDCWQHAGWHETKLTV